MGDLSLSDIKSGGIRVQILTEQTIAAKRRTDGRLDPRLNEFGEQY